MSSVKIITQYAMSMLNVPYKWGGDTPLEGLDCSGFIIHLLKAYGFFSSDYDNTAHGIWLWSKKIDLLGWDIPFEGCLIFYGTSEKVTHIAYSLNEKLTIQAQGGGSTNSGEHWFEVSKNKDSRIKILPYDYRSDVVDIRCPFTKI